MRSCLNLMLSILLAGTFAVGQTTTARASAPKAAKAADKPAAGTANLPSEETVDSFLHDSYGWGPDLSWKISGIRPAGTTGLSEITVVFASPEGQQTVRFLVTADGEHVLQGELAPFGAKPFDPARKLLEKGMNGPDRGPKNAAVTIVEFGDLQCPACKAAQPAIEKLIEAEPDVHFVFQNFPLEMHNWAAKGAAFADCVGRASNDAFWKFISKTYETQADITSSTVDEKLTVIADGAGVNGADIAACAVKPETKARIDTSIALGKSVDVTGTPALFINGRKIGNVSQVPLETLKSLIAFEAKQGK
jgi:protein-disulfide isomerase